MSIQASAATCPACGRPRAAAAECPHCGLIYARYRPRPSRATAEAPLRLRLSQQERLYGSLATAIEAGLPPATWLEVESGWLPGRLAEALRTDLRAGLPLSATFDRLGLLSPADRAFLQAGEARGALPATFALLARRAADKRKGRGKLLVALAYPVLLGLAALLILPVPLLFRDGPGAYAARVVPLLLLFGFLGFSALVAIPRMQPDAPLRRGLRRLALALPGTSHAIRDGSIATCLEVLGGCQGAGLPVRQALPLALEAASHPAFRSAEPERLLAGGRALAEALEAVGILPRATLAQIAQGELTGTLDRILPVLAAAHARRARTATWLVVAASGLLAAALVMGVAAWSVIEAWLLYFRQIARAAGG